MIYIDNLLNTGKRENRQSRPTHLCERLETNMADKYLTKIVAASLLGDGSVGIFPTYKNAVYRQPKRIDHKDYAEWLGDKLSTLTRVRYNEFEPKSQFNGQRQIMLTTMAHPFYTTFRERMYPNDHKVVDPHYLTLLDWEFLAIWFQEDGSTGYYKHKNGSTYINTVLCSQSFSYGDNHLLRKALSEKLGLDWNVASDRSGGKQKWFLKLRSSDIEKFMCSVEPYIVDSFKYKICHVVGSRLQRDEEIVRSAEESVELDRNDLVPLLAE